VTTYEVKMWRRVQVVEARNTYDAALHFTDRITGPETKEGYISRFICGNRGLVIEVRKVWPKEVKP